jgi:hypothetical protein
VTTDAERREATNQWTIQLREGQLREVRAQLAAATTETTEQAWEIAKLRYYVEALERRLAPSKRQQAAEAASHALAQHNPPQWIWDRDAQVKELQARILQLEVDRSIPMKLRDDTDTVVWALKPDNVPGAINWGDLGAREVQEVVTDERRWYRVVIEEADPSNDALHAAVLAGLAALGWNTDDIELETAW